MSSLGRGHANLLSIVPILVYVTPKRVRKEVLYRTILTAGFVIVYYVVYVIIIKTGSLWLLNLKSNRIFFFDNFKMD